MEASAPPEGETPSQRQARLRRERRQAKIATGGTDRLAAITGASGRKNLVPEATPVAQPEASTQEDETHYADPDHMDIDQAIGQPKLRPSPSPQPSRQANVNVNLQYNAGQQADTDDPMMKMMQQLLAGSGAFDPNNPNALPPSLASLLSANGANGLPQDPQAAQQQQQPPTVSAATWRVVHALVSLTLALAVTLSSPVRFNGSRASRERAALLDGVVGSEVGARLFFWFASVEVVLQSSRFFMERGQLRSGGILGTVTQLLPEPWAGYVRVIGRYGTIFATIVSDALVIVFALGAVAWWNGGIDAERVK